MIQEAELESQQRKAENQTDVNTTQTQPEEETLEIIVEEEYQPEEEVVEIEETKQEVEEQEEDQLEDDEEIPDSPQEEIEYEDPKEDPENLFACDENDNIVLELVDATQYDAEEVETQLQASENLRNSVDPNYFIDVEKETQNLDFLWQEYRKNKVTKFKILLDEYDIIREQEEEIENAKKLLQWDERKGDHSVLSMLKKYRWRAEALSHDYWDQGEAYVYKKCGIPVQEVEELEIEDDSCPACFCDGVTKTRNPLCGHSFCNDCWRTYLEVKIKESLGMGHTRINCMDCDAALTDDFIFSFFKSFNDESIKMKYIENKVDTYVSDHFLVTRCPRRSCKCAVKKLVDEPIHKVKCYCGEVFCFQCGRAPHYPSTCEMYKDFIAKSEDMTSAATYDYISKNTKPCPNCDKVSLIILWY